MLRTLTLLRLTLAFALALSAFAPHGGRAAGRMMVICGAERTYAVPLEPAAPDAPPHDCCLAACWAVPPATPAAAAQVAPRRGAPPPRGRRPARGRRASAGRAREPPARV